MRPLWPALCSPSSASPAVIEASPITFRTRGKRPSRDYESELNDLRAARDELRSSHDKIALVGRSFGGRMCAFLAEREPPDALAIMGHPISPPDRPRPRDEEQAEEWN